MSMSSEVLTTPHVSSLNTTQNTAVSRLYEHNHTLLVADKGAGKTRTGMVAAWELIQDGELSSVLVLCPNKVRGGWLAEAGKLGLADQIVLVEGSERQRDRLLRGPVPLKVMGVDLIPWLVDTYHKANRCPVDGLILDETTRYSKPGSAGVRALRKFHKRLRWVVGMTAQPVMENPLALFGQCAVVDGGQALGRNYDTFKRTYFYPTDYQGYNWELLPGAAPRLAAAVQGLVYHMADTDYADSLPPLTEELVPIAVPGHFWRAYTDMADSMLIEMEMDGVEIEAVNAAVVSGKLEQLCQGAVYDQNQVPHWIHFAKMDWLQANLDLSEGPVIVVYQYEFERDELRQRFPWGRDLSEPGALEAFNGGEVDLLTMHFKSGSHGINAQERCCEMICLKPCWSADGWAQIIGRIRRRGQTRPCRRRTLVVPGTVDELILARLDGKEQVGETLLDHIKAKAKGLQ